VASSSARPSPRSTSTNVSSLACSPRARPQPSSPVSADVAERDAGTGAILFGLTGPSAAVASGPGGALDALALAVDLVRAGDCDRIVVAAVDVVGPASAFVLSQAFADHTDVVTGAVAALVTAEPSGAIADLSEPIAPCGFGHKALEACLVQLTRLRG